MSSMKRALVWLLVASVVCPNYYPAYAGKKEKEQIEALKRHLITLKEKYPEYIHNVHSQAIHGLFLQTLEDYRAITQFTENEIRRSAQRLAEIRHEFSELRSQINPSLSTFDEDISVYSGLKAAIEREKNILNTSLSDLVELRQGWENRCSRETLTSLAEVYEPTRIYSLDNIDFNVSPEPRVFGFGGSVDTSGGGQSLNIPGAGVSTREGVLTTGGSALGGSYPGALGVSKPVLGLTKPVIGGIIGFGIGLLVSAIFAWITGENTEALSSEINQIWEQVRLIREAQKDMVKQESDQSPTLIQQSCQEFLPDTFQSYLNERIQLAQNQVSISQQAIVEHEQGWRGIQEAFRQKVLELENHTFPWVQENFVNLMNQISTQAVELNRQSMGFIHQQIAPILRENQILATYDFLGKVDLKDQLWTETIRGDSQYHRASEFSFVSTDDVVELRETSYWDAFLKKLRPAFEI